MPSKDRSSGLVDAGQLVAVQLGDGRVAAAEGGQCKAHRRAGKARNGNGTAARIHQQFSVKHSTVADAGMSRTAFHYGIRLKPEARLAHAAAALSRRVAQVPARLLKKVALI